MHDNFDFGHNPEHNFFQLPEVKLNACFNCPFASILKNVGNHFGDHWLLLYEQEYTDISNNLILSSTEEINQVWNDMSVNDEIINIFWAEEWTIILILSMLDTVTAVGLFAFSEKSETNFDPKAWSDPHHDQNSIMPTLSSEL